MIRREERMRVLFNTSGWPTHLYMVASLAQAFRTAGHEIRVAGPPMGRSAVLAAGLPFVEVGRDVDFIEIRRRVLPYEAQWEEVGYTEDEHDAGPWLEEARRLSGIGDVLSGWQETAFTPTADLVAFARAWQPELIVTDDMSLSALVAGHVTGVPVVRHLLATDVIGSVEAEDLFLEEIPGFAEHCAVYGMELSGDPAAATVDPSPPSMQPPAGPRRHAMRWVPYNGPGSAPDWLLEPPSRPRVCVTWGTSTVWSAGRRHFLVSDILEVLAGFDAEIVVTVGSGQREMLGLGQVGANVRVLESMPLHFLMPSCDLVIHQGGSSTMLTAAYYGVRQLAVPYLPEQVADARSHASTGAGLWLFGTDEADRHSVHASVDALLHDPQFREAADRLRREIATQPSPAETVRTLERLAA
ncbi:nucleotide disphospho-sugar-binding domain-containing protein [Streptomyces iconiensis]|uniref:DUF1205 domain-containing protein n=1 Tax=Streptomyces iconiensis TaxID=1384038 RepID=A0ABT7A6B4_9ACTN|nr:nucleotide disphospho-sugar-binding domain-containing protein [Streptomyces iconiensis]MDJ1136883.1 DUF1205 domain-containing protein [Streptomyces iconiensis]